MNPTDLETRILTLLDGELPSREATELEAILLHDEQARETYRNLVMIHNALESRFAAAATVKQMAIVPMDRVISAQRRGMVRNALFASAAVLMVSMVTMWLVLAPKHAVNLGSIRTAPDSLLAMQYEGKGKPPEGAELVEGARLLLSKGTMEGTFKSGVRLVAVAPCEMRIVDKERVSLESGKVWFEVPPKAVGFTVDTPQCRIVDLGTEFGVISSIATPDEVHVFKGKVEITPLHGSGGSTTRVAGQAIRLAADAPPLEIPADASLFTDKLPVTRGIVIVNHSFEDDVLHRDGNPATKKTGMDDYDRDLVPYGWVGFGREAVGKVGVRGVLSTAPGSYFSTTIRETPDADENDQVFYSTSRDIYQVLSEPIRPNLTYVLSVDIGHQMIAAADGAVQPEIQLGVGNVPGEGLLKPTSVDTPPGVDGGWVQWSATYVTGPEVPEDGAPLRIELITNSRGGLFGLFDRVRLTVTH